MAGEGWHTRWPLWLTAALMGPLLASVFKSQPRLLAAPFNPVALNLGMAALSAVALLAGRKLPDAGRCKREPGQLGRGE